MTASHASHAPSSLLLLPLLLLLLLPSCSGSLATHRYLPDERVNLYVNKIGPYNNPLETYPYYSLPYCHPVDGHETNKHKQGISLGETLEGHSLRESGFHIFFAKDVQVEELCTMTLKDHDVKLFNKAVRQQYFYQMYIDDLPVWGMVGESHASIDKAAAASNPSSNNTNHVTNYLFTKRHIALEYNGDRIITVNMTNDGLEPIVVGHEVTFEMTVSWTRTEGEFHNRFERYLDNEFFEHTIHWFSIFNSFMMVIFLVGVVSLILVRALKKDYQKYSSTDTDLENMVEDSGWKQVHGDVFRPPAFLTLFSAILGAGWQLVVLTLGVILFAIGGPVHGDVYESRGEVVTAGIVCYTLSSIVAGYVSGSYYKQFFPTPRAEAGSKWKSVMLLTIGLLPATFGSILSVLNAVAVYYGTVNTMPILVTLKVIAIWCFVSVPLTVLGTLFGRHYGGKANFPTRVNAIPRPIPEAQSWHGNPIILVPLTGILPFGSIFIELYFLFTSYWNYKFYYVYGFMLLVYAILAIVTMCCSIVATYCLLNSENYQWQWTSFAASSSAGFYVFLYSLYYFYAKTNMTGLLQTVFYFGYMGIQAIVLSLLCGTFGFVSCNWFVRTIFRNVKID